MFLYYLQRLDMMVGMMKILNLYNIRLGTGEAVNSVSSLTLFCYYSTKQDSTAVGTQEQLQQIMGHKNAGIFQTYINK